MRGVALVMADGFFFIVCRHEHNDVSLRVSPWTSVGVFRVICLHACLNKF